MGRESSFSFLGSRRGNREISVRRATHAISPSTKPPLGLPVARVPTKQASTPMTSGNIKRLAHLGKAMQRRKYSRASLWTSQFDEVSLPTAPRAA
jgi:hypothetical protein